MPIYCGEEVEFDPSEIDKLVPPLQLTDSGPHHHGFTLVGESGDTEKTQPLKVNEVPFSQCLSPVRTLINMVEHNKSLKTTIILRF